MQSSMVTILIVALIVGVGVAGLGWLSLRLRYTEASREHPELAGRWSGGKLTPAQERIVRYAFIVATVLALIGTVAGVIALSTPT